jgi:hypothetical protein
MICLPFGFGREIGREFYNIFGARLASLSRVQRTAAEWMSGRKHPAS